MHARHCIIVEQFLHSWLIVAQAVAGWVVPFSKVVFAKGFPSMTFTPLTVGAAVPAGVKSVKLGPLIFTA